MSTKDTLDGDEGFVSRWSRRKNAGTDNTSNQSETDTSDPPSIPLNTVLPGNTTGRMSTAVEADRLRQEAADSNEEKPVLTDADMPDIDTLQEGSDFTGFMSPGVSDKLRKLALKKLFAGAGFNIRDGLDDYDEDFTNFAPLGDIVTCDMKHRAEMAEEKRLRELAEAEAAEAEKHGDGQTDENLLTEDETLEASDQELEESTEVTPEELSDASDSPENEEEQAENQHVSKFEKKPGLSSQS